MNLTGPWYADIFGWSRRNCSSTGKVNNYETFKKYKRWYVVWQHILMVKIKYKDKKLCKLKDNKRRR